MRCCAKSLADATAQMMCAVARAGGSPVAGQGMAARGLGAGGGSSESGVAKLPRPS